MMPTHIYALIRNQTTAMNDEERTEHASLSKDVVGTTGIGRTHSSGFARGHQEEYGTTANLGKELFQKLQTECDSLSPTRYFLTTTR